MKSSFLHVKSFYLVECDFTHVKSLKYFLFSTKTPVWKITPSCSCGVDKKWGNKQFKKGKNYGPKRDYVNKKKEVKKLLLVWEL